MTENTRLTLTIADVHSAARRLHGLLHELPLEKPITTDDLEEVSHASALIAMSVSTLIDEAAVAAVPVDPEPDEPPHREDVEISDEAEPTDPSAP